MLSVLPAAHWQEQYQDDEHSGTTDDGYDHSHCLTPCQPNILIYLHSCQTQTQQNWNMK